MASSNKLVSQLVGNDGIFYEGAFLFSCTCIFTRYFILLKFGYSEKATKFEKNLRRTFDKSVVFCARNSVLVKKSTKIFKNKCGQVVITLK